MAIQAKTLQAKGGFTFKSWDEKPYMESNGQKMTRAHVENTFDGDIKGNSTVDYLMFYPNEKTATYLGLEHIVGSIGDRKGSFVLQHTGVYEDGAAKTSWSVVPGSGTSDLLGLQGEGSFVGVHEQPTPFTLDYWFED
jgi:hypothetical protein